MKKLLWTSAMALTAAACMTACDDSSSGASNSIPEFKTEAALPDTCEMEVAKAGNTYFACFENKWIEVTDSATVEQFKEGLDEDEVKAKLEELEDLLKPATPAKPKSSSSKKTDEDVESSDSDEPESSASEEECTGRRCKTGNSSSSKKSSGGSGSGDSGEGGGEGGEGGDSSPSSATSDSGSEEDTPDGLPACNAALKDTVKWTGEFTSAGSLIPDETKAGKYYACDGSKWAEVTKLHYAFGATCEAFKNTIQKIYDANFINNPDNWTDPFTGKAFNSDLNVLTDGNGTVLSSGGKMLGLLVPEWNGKTEIYTYNGVIYSSPLCKNDEYTVAPVGASPMRRLCTKDNVGDRGRAFKQGSTVYSDNYWVCYEKGDGTYEWGQGFVDSRTKTGVVGDPLRFGTIYRQVTIGEQTWMAENVNYETTSGSFCSDDEPNFCDKYGRFYTWTAAKEACPTGWSLPTNDDWNVLFNEVGGIDVAGRKLRSTSGWKDDDNGTDDYGFSILPAGFYFFYSSSESYTQTSKTTHAEFWVNNELSTTDAYRMYFYYLYDQASPNTYPKNHGFSVRCIKD